MNPSTPLAIGLAFFTATAASAANAEPALTSPKAPHVLSSDGWDRFCDRLKEIGQIVQSEGVPENELDRLEGTRYLLATLAESIDVALHRSDLSDPQVRFNITKYRAAAMPSSDARYLSAEITGDGVYQLSGTLGNAPHITVQAYGGVGALESIDLASLADSEGNFVVTIGGRERDGGAWMRVSPIATMLFFREYFSDWADARPSKFILERLDRPARGTPLSAPILAQLLDDVAGKMERQVPYWKGRMDQIRAGHDNDLAPPGTLGDVGLGDIQYGTGWFDLRPDEAMLIELTPPQAVHWSFQLGNYWGETLDFANFTSSLNGHQATRSSDGVYRLVIAHSDPGVPNWLDTAGHREGMIFYRYHLATSKPVPTARVVELSELAALLPANTPSVTPEERRTEIDRRRASVVRRWTP
jgi:hypothetical protein